MDINKLSVI